MTPATEAALCLWSSTTWMGIVVDHAFVCTASRYVRQCYFWARLFCFVFLLEIPFFFLFFFLLLLFVRVGGKRASTPGEKRVDSKKIRTCVTFPEQIIPDSVFHFFLFIHMTAVFRFFLMFFTHIYIFYLTFNTYFALPLLTPAPFPHAPLAPPPLDPPPCCPAPALLRLSLHPSIHPGLANEGPLRDRSPGRIIGAASHRQHPPSSRCCSH